MHGVIMRAHWPGRLSCGTKSLASKVYCMAIVTVDNNCLTIFNGLTLPDGQRVSGKHNAEVVQSEKSDAV